MPPLAFTTQQFIEKVKEVHGDKYDYSLVEYTNALSKIKIVCHIHGIFEQCPHYHKQGQGCPKCAVDRRVLIHKCTTEKSILKFIKKHGNLYDYSKFEDKGNRTKSIIICKIHGEFLQSPNDHIQGNGCPKCQTSKGELVIEQWLQNHNIEYVLQYKFKGCKGKTKLLPFDFYLPQYNTCIEFDGKQHFEVIPRSKDQQKNIQNFIDLSLNDITKDTFCITNNITLIRIPYNKNIEDVLTSHF